MNTQAKLSLAAASATLATLAIGGFSDAAQAATIRYQIDATFADGGTLSGFFDWDTDLPDLAPPHDGNSNNYEITSSGGAFSDLTYTDEVDGPLGTVGAISGSPIIQFGDAFSGVNPRRFSILIDTNTSLLGIDLNIPLAISPGNTSELDLSAGFNTRQMTSGQLTGTVLPSQAVPEPSSVIGLLGIGALGLGLKRKKQTPDSDRA